MTACRSRIGKVDFLTIYKYIVRCIRVNFSLSHL
jgi:hypothetical protein